MWGGVCLSVCLSVCVCVCASESCKTPSINLQNSHIQGALDDFALSFSIGSHSLSYHSLSTIRI